MRGDGIENILKRTFNNIQSDGWQFWLLTKGNPDAPYGKHGIAFPA